MISVVVSLYLFNGGSHASDTLHVLMGDLGMVPT